MSKRKITYLGLFTLFGILLSFTIHGVVEIAVIKKLLIDFEKYGLGFTWHQWYQVHNIGTVVLFLLGALFGFLQGEYWWKRLYEKTYVSRLKNLFKRSRQ